MTYVGLGTRLVKHTEQLNPMSLGKKGGAGFLELLPSSIWLIICIKLYRSIHVIIHGGTAALIEI